MSVIKLEDRVLNLVRPKPDERDYPIILSSANFPAVYKPGDIEELLLAVAVDQGLTGSCVGQTLAKQLSIIAYRQSGVTYKYSPYWLWVNRYLNFDGRMTGEGTDPKMQALMAKSDGACFDTQYQIDISKTYLYADLEKAFYGEVKPKFEKTAKLHAPDLYAFPSSVEEVKQAILDNGSCLIGVAVNQSWGTVGPNGVIPKRKGDSDLELGGHAMLIYGWDDKKEVWLGHNSWGTAWGKNGFFEIPMDYGIFHFGTFLDTTNMHWAHKMYYYLWEKGVKIYDQRFDDTITRGEVFAIMARVMGYKE